MGRSGAAGIYESVCDAMSCELQLQHWGGGGCPWPVCPLWAEDEVVVGAGVASPGGGGIVLGVGVCVWAG